jgi:hypothetical protein
VESTTRIPLRESKKRAVSIQFNFGRKKSWFVDLRGSIAMVKAVIGDETQLTSAEDRLSQSGLTSQVSL